jgi:hypothetical protein
MMVLSDNFVVFAADVDAALVLCAWKILVLILGLSRIRTIFMPPCNGISCHRLMWLLVAYQQLSVVASKGFRFCQV